METCFHFVIILKLISITYVLWLAWKLSFVYLSFYRELDYAPSYLAGLPVYPLNPKACLNLVALSNTLHSGVILLLFNVFFIQCGFLLKVRLRCSYLVKRKKKCLFFRAALTFLNLILLLLVN